MSEPRIVRVRVRPREERIALEREHHRPRRHTGFNHSAIVSHFVGRTAQ